MSAFLVLVATVAGCASEEPALTRPIELVAGPLAAGTYTRTGFIPPIEFTLAEGWTGGTVSDGFFDIQQDPGSPDVIAVQFARVQAVVGAERATVPATTAAAAVATIAGNPDLVVFGESESLLGGLEGYTVEVENQGTRTASVMRVQPGILGFDPGRRLWISLFDTSDGLLAVMVGGSVVQWDRALTAAEPVLESVVIGVEANGQ